MEKCILGEPRREVYRFPPAVAFCVFLMKLATLTRLCFAVRLVPGLLVYFGYSHRRSLLHVPA